MLTAALVVALGGAAPGVLRCDGRTDVVPVRGRVGSGTGADPRPDASVGVGIAASTSGRQRARVPRPGAFLFSFAVISDTHERRSCRVLQGRYVAEALKVIVARRPAFVVGLGDLIAGGGDCRRRVQQRRRQTAEQQLDEVRRAILERLPMPFVPVAGNHDLLPEFSSDPGFARRAWRAFWRANIRHISPAQIAGDPGESYRFTHLGVGIAAIGFYGTEGLHQAELDWIRKHVQPGDLVFRHINPFGISCMNERLCGIAVSRERLRKPLRLVSLLKARQARALFSGHTHAFYEGDCAGLRFVNVGALGDRSMEYVRGWSRSPYRKRAAFTWVDVHADGRLRITFHVWNPDPAPGRFEVFDPKHFPEKVSVHPVRQRDRIMGVRATCISRRGPRG